MLIKAKATAIFFCDSAEPSVLHYLLSKWQGDCFFFLEHAGEMCIIILRRKGLEPVQHPPKYMARRLWSVTFLLYPPREFLKFFIYLPLHG
jgi:hypothetical protein